MTNSGRKEIRFDGRVAIVTGAGAGLGRTYALALARRGARVVVNDLGGARDGTGGSSAPAKQVLEEIRALGGEAVANYDTVATPEGGENIVKTAMDAFGSVEILINNAGILRDKSFLNLTPENWDAVLAVHLNGAYNVTRPAFRVMREKAYGRILMTTSTSGLFGNFGQTNYGSAKTGLIGLANVLKLEGAKYHIKVNTICPSAGSRMTEDVISPDLYKAFAPELVTPLVLYLVSDECKESGYIYYAGGGLYCRVAVVRGPGITLGDREDPPTVEEIRDHWEAIHSIEGAEEGRPVFRTAAGPEKS